MQEPTNTTIANVRRLSPAIFLVALLCFLLPFATVSCDASGAGGGRIDITTMTGLEVIAGKDVSVTPATVGTAQTGHIDSEPMALIAALALLVGIGITFLPGRPGAIAGALCGGAAFLFLLLTKFAIDNRVNRPANIGLPNDSPVSIPTGVAIVAVYQFGYWLALGLSAIAAGVFLYLYVAEARATEE